MRRVLVAFIVLCVSLPDCGRTEQRIEPSRPDQVSGWKDRRENGRHILGEFVLIKGEVTDNGKIKVKVIDLIPGDPITDAGSVLYQARVKLQFIRVSDDSILCEETFPEKGSMTLSPTKCGTDLDESGIFGVYINGINLKQGWVHFELLG